MTSAAAADTVARTGEGRRIIVIMGAPGAGKGTQAERLAAELELPHISTGELFRELLKSPTPLAQEIQSYLDHGALVPDEITVKMVETRLAEPDARSGAILDGYPRNASQAVALDELLGRQGSQVTEALYVEVPTDHLVERLSGRRVCSVDDQHMYHVASMPPKQEGICDIDGAELIHRADDCPETIQERLDRQLPPMYEVVDHYTDNKVLFSVRGDKPAEEVTEDLLRALHSRSA